MKSAGSRITYKEPVPYKIDMPESRHDSLFEFTLPEISSRPHGAAAIDILQGVFGYAAFRPGQSDIVEHIIHGYDALVLMTTGGGKSLCYQVPALARAGMGVVISPLIPLMKDQVDALRKRGIRAGALTHLLSEIEKAEIETAVRENTLDILYVSPERLQSQSFRRLIRNVKLSLIAIDEAHVMSRWGHDFREAYLKIRDFLSLFANVPKVALTATADPDTQADICLQADLKDYKVFQTSFNRPNLRIEVNRRSDAARDCLRLINLHENEDGIIFCPTRKSVEELTKKLSEKGINCVGYHAGMTKEERTHAQLRFMREKNVVAIATIAFGMGIDKPNIRFVIHTSVPATAEAYYQEIGRAGRDGLDATAYLLFRASDTTHAQRTLLGRLEEEVDAETRRFLLKDLIKLQDMMGFLESPECRKKTLLNFFGEKLSSHCGNCDRCQNPIHCEDCSEEVRLLVKAIASTGQKFGTTHLVEVLQGLKTVKVAENEHDHLSVFGKGRLLLKKDWMSVIRQTRAAGLIRPASQGGWELEETAWPFLRGQGTIKLNILKARHKPVVVEQAHHGTLLVPNRDLPESTERLSTDLIDWREKLSESTRRLVRNDVLTRILSFLPRTKDEVKHCLGAPNHLSGNDLEEVVRIVIKHKGPLEKNDPLETICF